MMIEIPSSREIQPDGEPGEVFSNQHSTSSSFKPLNTMFAMVCIAFRASAQICDHLSTSHFQLMLPAPRYLANAFEMFRIIGIARNFTTISSYPVERRLFMHTHVMTYGQGQFFSSPKL